MNSKKGTPLANRREEVNNQLLEMGIDPYNKIIVLHELGAFYEAFGSRAQVVANICGLMVSVRWIAGVDTSMAGFPVYQLDEMRQKLHAAGYTVVTDNGSNLDIRPPKDTKLNITIS